jgi:hypothetical protein
MDETRLAASHNWLTADNVPPGEYNQPEGYVYCGTCLAPMTAATAAGECPREAISQRLEALRASLRAENISWGELSELQGLASHIDPGDVELLEAAGVPEHSPAEAAERVIELNGGR